MYCFFLLIVRKAHMHEHTHAHAEMSSDFDLAVTGPSLKLCSLPSQYQYKT